MQPEDSAVNVFVGFDPAELTAFTVAEFSMRAHCSLPLNLRRLALVQLTRAGLYWRPTEHLSGGQLWDPISGATMSTEHAISRFLVPALADYRGWALFTDGDILVRDDLAQLWALRDERYAVMVVQHPPADGLDAVKKDGAQQTNYSRKWWSSVMLFNCGHEANAALTPDLVNRLPGRDLHRFCWLKDEEIGALPMGWNYLVGVTAPRPEPVSLVHFTLGTPNLPEWEDSEFADEWLAIARRKQPSRATQGGAQPWV